MKAALIKLAMYNSSCSEAEQDLWALSYRSEGREKGVGLMGEGKAMWGSAVRGESRCADRVRSSG